LHFFTPGLRVQGCVRCCPGGAALALVIGGWGGYHNKTMRRIVRRLCDLKQFKTTAMSIAVFRFFKGRRVSGDIVTHRSSAAWFPSRPASPGQMYPSRRHAGRGPMPLLRGRGGALCGWGGGTLPTHFTASFFELLKKRCSRATSSTLRPR